MKIKLFLVLMETILTCMYKDHRTLTYMLFYKPSFSFQEKHEAKRDLLKNTTAWQIYS